MSSGGEIVWKVGALPGVLGDPSVSRLVVGNLPSNAVKYTRTRDRAIIEVGSTRDGRESALFVQDNGVGFDVQYENKLFGVFQRLHAAEEFEGTDIGLANVRRIVNRHGEHVWAEGREGRGPTSSSRYRGSGRRMVDDPGVISLVEDNPNDAEITLAALGECRPIPEVFVANSGREALDYLYRRGGRRSRLAANPRLVLPDLKLPKVDGLEVLECIKTDPDPKTIPVVKHTPRARRGTRREATISARTPSS